MELTLLGIMIVIGGRHLSFSLGFSWPLVPMIQIILEPTMIFWTGNSPLTTASGVMNQVEDLEMPAYRIGIIKTKMMVSSKDNKLYEADGDISLITRNRDTQE